jgi:hypothetical protein
MTELVPPPSGFVLEQSQGALFTTVPTRRNVRIYAIQESEMDTISVINALTTFFFSAGASLLTGVITLQLDLLIESNPTDTAKLAVKLLTWFATPLGIACICAAIFAVRRRRSMLERIKGETEVMSGG